jgi:polyphenol oxidase
VPLRWQDDHLVADLPHARAVFTTRRGGVSAGPFASLNLGLLTDDEPDNVAENRRRLASLVGHPWERFHFGRQVHGSEVATVNDHRDADGRATAQVAEPAIVFGADCMPVLLAAEGAVAALHCGYRPLAGGIVAKGLQALRDLGATGPVTALIGPGARGCCYEVGPEVHALFADYDARHGNNLDLAAVAIQQLDGAEIHDTGLCTICDERFFSYRRDGATGRQSGVICRA